MWWWALVACVEPDDGVPPQQTRITEVQGLKIEIERVPNPLAAVAQVTSGADRTLSFVATAGDRSLRTPEVSLRANVPTEVPILGLHAGRWTLQAEVDGQLDAQWSLETERPEDFVDSPTNDIQGGYSPDEAICASRESREYAYVCTNRSGEPTLYAPLPLNAMFVRPLADGTFLAHPDGGQHLVHFDALGRELDEIWADDLFENTTYPQGRIDEHDVVEIQEGPWTGAWAVLTATEEDERIGAGIVVWDPVGRRVLWDWSAHGTPEDGVSIDEALLPSDRWGVQEHGEDWLHANALLHGTDAEGDFFWMSLRHQDWIIEIRAPSGAISLRFGLGGDVDLLDGDDADWFFHQHAPEWRRISDTEFEVLVFDNGNARPGTDDPRTRIVTYVLDRQARTATRRLDIETQFFAPAAGDADRMPTGDGILITRAVGEAFVAEIGPDGSRRWVQRIPQEGEVYRAEFYPSLYDTAWFSRTGW